MASFGLDMVRQTLNSARAEYEDNTEGIRQARASKRLRADVQTVTSAIVQRAALRGRLGGAPISGVTDRMQQVAALTELDLDELFVECKQSAKFLFENMPVVFAKLFQNQLDVPLFLQMLDVLESVELGERDQNEGSEEVGRMLHRCFIGGHVPTATGVVGRAAKEGEEAAEKKPQKPTLTWAEYRAQRNQGTYTEMQRAQCMKEASRAKLRAAIERKKQQSRGGK